MKLRILSDLHLEGYKFEYESMGEDAIVLAGDITTKNRHGEFVDHIMDRCEYVGNGFEQGPPHILLVAGNHEYYHSEFHKVNKYLSELHICYPNVHFLNNSYVTIGDVSFFGGTMFTDFGLYGESERWFAEHDAQKGIADFHHIEVKEMGPHYEIESWQWTVKDHKEQHEIFNRSFDQWRNTIKIVNPDIRKLVCVSHFMPSEKSVSPRFLNSMLNPYFTANNEERLQQVDYWIHGHTHDSFHYWVGETQVYCNPRGYGKENIGGFDPKLVIEI